MASQTVHCRETVPASTKRADEMFNRRSVVRGVVVFTGEHRDVIYFIVSLSVIIIIIIIIIISVMELGHLLTRSGLTYPEVSPKVYHDSFCQLGSSVSLPWVISYFEAFYSHVLSSFSCISVICPKLVLFLTPLQFVHLFCNS